MMACFLHIIEPGALGRFREVYPATSSVIFFGRNQKPIGSESFLFIFFLLSCTLCDNFQEPYRFRPFVLLAYLGDRSDHRVM